MVSRGPSKKGQLPRGRMRGFRRGRGSGPEILSTPARFLSLARGGLKDRGGGRRGRVASSIATAPLVEADSDGLDLQVVLPNFIPNLIVPADGGEVGGVVVETESSDIGGDHGNAHRGVLAAERLLFIGKQIGVTLSCDEGTMNDRLVQLEERDRLAKEISGMGNIGPQ